VFDYLRATTWAAKGSAEFVVAMKAVVVSK
jgi:hypothetical protein